MTTLGTHRSSVKGQEMQTEQELRIKALELSVWNYQGFATSDELIEGTAFKFLRWMKDERP